MKPDCSSINVAEKSNQPEDWLLHPTGYVFQFGETPFDPGPINVDSDNFKFTYCCSSDTYNLNGKSVSGWKNFVFDTTPFARKEDYIAGGSYRKEVYIARKGRGSLDPQEIEWKFSLPNKPLKKLKVFKISF